MHPNWGPPPSLAAKEQGVVGRIPRSLPLGYDGVWSRAPPRSAVIMSAFSSSDTHEGGASHDDCRWDRARYPLVERTNQGPMAGLVGRLVRLDTRRVRLHGIPADHGADRQRVRRLLDGSDRCLHDYAVDASRRCVRVGLARRSRGAQDPADDFDRLVLTL